MCYSLTHIDDIPMDSTAARYMEEAPPPPLDIMILQFKLLTFKGPLPKINVLISCALYQHGHCSLCNPRQMDFPSAVGRPRLLTHYTPPDNLLPKFFRVRPPVSCCLCARDNKVFTPPAAPLFEGIYFNQGLTSTMPQN